MDPPPLSATASAVATAPTTTTPTPISTSQSYPDSVDSSPRSRHTDSWDDPPLNTSSGAANAGTKLRLMCSYGGHIVPRPHDKSLCYVGGETRIIVVDRNVTLTSLTSRLSQSLLNGRPFSLKYQLPSEDLDSLISVTTDEDLENMIEEYERTSSNYQKPCRLRLFLFQNNKLESSQSQSILEGSTKSDEWFLNALNGASGALNRGFSESASVNCLLGLDDEIVLAAAGGGSSGGGGGVVKKAQDVHSVPDSPMMETTSSFGSSSSSPSLANLPPIRVHVEENVNVNSAKAVQDQKQMVGIEEQFGQLNVVGGGVSKQVEEGFVVLSSPPPSLPQTTVGMSGVVVSGDYVNRVISDDERSDHGVPVAYRKAPAQPQSQPQPQKTSGGGGGSGGAGFDLPSPDSVSSDSSLTNAISRQKPVIYQDPVMQMQSGANRVPVNPVDPKVNPSDPNTNTRVHLQQVQDSASGYVLQQAQLEQQQQQLQQQLQQQQQHQQQLQHQLHQQQQHQLQQQQQHQQQHQLQQQQQHQQQQQQQPPQPQPQQQQQFVHPGAHYIQQHPAGAVPISHYYPVYPSQQQQQHQHQHQHQHHQHHQVDQQYPVYYVSARQPQAAYNMSVQQPNAISESPTSIPSSRPQTPPSPAMVASSAAYNPMRNAHMGKPEMGGAGVYRTATTGGPQLVQVPVSQHQQPYVGYAQIHHPSQSVAAPTSAAATANYGYEFSDPAHAQIYYTQPMAPTMTSQYQTMAGTAAVVLPDSSAQLSAENIKQQQIRTSQPL